MPRLFLVGEDGTDREIDLPAAPGEALAIGRAAECGLVLGVTGVSRRHCEIVVTKAIREAHADETRFRDETIARLRKDHDRLQGLLDRLAEEYLVGRFDAAFYERKRDEWRRDQDRLSSEIAAHTSADRTYVEEGIQLLELNVGGRRSRRHVPPTV